MSMMILFHNEMFLTLLFLRKGEEDSVLMRMRNPNATHVQTFPTLKRIISFRIFSYTRRKNFIRLNFDTLKISFYSYNTFYIG